MSAYRNLAVVLLFSIFLAACLPTAQSGTVTPAAIKTPNEAQTTEAEVVGRLVIYSGRSEPLIQPVLAAFKEKYPQVEILLKAGSNSEIANALIEEQVNSQADVFITTEIFTVQSLAEQGIFQPYIPAGAAQLPAGFASPDHLWHGLTRRGRVIMYNTELVTPEEAPKSIFELTDPRWKGQVAAAGSTNGSMQAQIAAMRLMIGEQATEQWLQDLIANDVTFFGGHTDVRKAVGAGEFKLGLVNHYYYYLQQAEGSPVGMLIPDQADDQIGMITNATAAALVEGARNTAAAQAFLDFLLSDEGQKLFAELNYEFPLLSGVPLHNGVQPLEQFRLADVDMVKASQEYNATFDLMEKVGLP